MSSGAVANGTPDWRIAARRRRRIRLRSVACPTRLVTVRPTRRPWPAASSGMSSPSLRRPWTVTRSVWKRRPVAAARNSGRFVSRPSLGSSDVARPDGSCPPATRRSAIRPRGAYGPAPGGPRSPCVRQPSPCGHESRGAACGRSCSVGRSSSRLFSGRDSGSDQRPTALSNASLSANTRGRPFRGRYASGGLMADGSGEVNAPEPSAAASGPVHPGEHPLLRSHDPLQLGYVVVGLMRIMQSGQSLASPSS
jgi:hypothetical protein